MDALERLVEWATARGVVLDGIAPQRLPGRGVGIVATRAIEAGEVVLRVPAALLRCLGSTPRAVVRRLDGASAHAVLAAALCLDAARPGFAAWRAVLPPRAAVEAAMPLCWPRAWRDWRRVAAALPGLRAADFRYAWCLVNSRSFYHDAPAGARLPPADRLALQPVADLFNHGPGAGCAVAADARGFAFTATRAHGRGDELLIRYGAHSNDVLLVEYGFTLPANPCDEASLDACLCSVFSPAQRARLADAGFWGRYVLDAATPCYRTLTALRMLCLAPPQWRAVLDGARDELADQPAVDAALAALLRRYAADIAAAMAAVDAAAAGTADMRRQVRARWAQIQELVAATMSRLQA